MGKGLQIISRSLVAPHKDEPAEIHEIILQQATASAADLSGTMIR